jgi:hypothetical protein
MTTPSTRTPCCTARKLVATELLRQQLVQGHRRPVSQPLRSLFGSKGNQGSSDLHMQIIHFSPGGSVVFFPSKTLRCVKSRRRIEHPVAVSGKLRSLGLPLLK